MQMRRNTKDGEAVQRLSTGHRNDRDTTVSVSELVRRRPGAGTSEPDRIVLPVPDDHLGTLVTTAPYIPDSRMPLPVRITISFLCVLLVCGAAAATSAIITRPRQNPALAVQAGPISGTLALRPDLLREATWPFSANGGYATPDTAGPNTFGPSHAEDGTLSPNAFGPDTFTPDTFNPDLLSSARPRPARAVPQTPAMAQANPGAESMDSAAEVVSDFYARLGTDPSSAVDLLCPLLLGGAHDDLIRAWEGTSWVRALHVDPRPEGAVEAEVEAGYANGDRVVLRHQLRVEWHSDPEIVSAELITARKFHSR